MSSLFQNTVTSYAFLVLFVISEVYTYYFLQQIMIISVTVTWLETNKERKWYIP